MRAPLADLSTRLAGLSGRNRALAYGVLGAFGGLGHAPVAIPAFTVLALVMVFATRPWLLPRKAAAWAGWAFGAGYFAVTLHWIVEPFLVDVWRHGWMAPFALVLMCGGLALFWAAAFGVAGWRRSGLALVAAWAVAEFARANVFTGFPWGMMVTTGVEVWLYQGAAWLGPHGLTLVLFLAALATVSGPQSVRWVAAGALAGTAIAPVSPAEAPPDDAAVVRVVQPNARQDLKWDPDMIPVFLERKMQASAAAPPADLVIWPEVALPMWLREGGDILSEAAARSGGADLLIGAQRWRNGDILNTLAHVGPTGDVMALYDKHHLVPFGEYMPGAWLFDRFAIFGLAANQIAGFTPGPGAAVIDIPGLGPVQPLICYESIFAHEVGRGVTRPRLIAVVTNDAWFGQVGGPAQHLAQAQARAIEQGVPVARSANTGISAIIDARGQIIASLPLGVEGYADASLPAARTATPYARWGDWLFLGLLTFVVLLHLLGRRVRS